MAWTSIVAIYFLFWVMSAFVMLPIGVRTPHEDGITPEPGHADSAPTNFRPARIVIGATLLSGVLFGLFYANYVFGWISAESFGVRD